MTDKKCLPPAAARHFLEHYQNLLEAIPAQSKPGASLVVRLAQARDAVHSNPALLEPALALLRQNARPCADDVLQAVRSLRLERWVYIGDTTTHSQLLEMRDDGNAYAVKTLTTPLKDMLGVSSAVIECGLLEFQGQIICDGLLRLHAELGPNYRRSFKEALAACRAQGRLYRDRLLPAGLDQQKR